MRLPPQRTGLERQLHWTEVEAMLETLVVVALCSRTRAMQGSIASSINGLAILVRFGSTLWLRSPRRPLMASQNGIRVFAYLGPQVLLYLCLI